MEANGKRVFMYGFVWRPKSTIQLGGVHQWLNAALFHSL